MKYTRLLWFNGMDYKGNIMKMNIKMLKAAFAGLVLSVSGFSNAGLITVVNDATGTERASFGATDTMDWSVLGTSYTRLSNSFSTSTIEGNNLTVSQSGSGFEHKRQIYRSKECSLVRHRTGNDIYFLEHNLFRKLNWV